MKKIFTLLVSFSLISLMAAPTAAVGGGHVSKSPAFWTFGVGPVGSTKLVRTRNGLTGQFKTTGLTAGHAVTLWIMFFDNPEACTVPGFCNPDIDIGREGVRFDFHYAGGHIVNDSKTTLTGHVRVGELSTSGWAELVAIGGAPPFFVTPLTNPMGAQVILAIHSHGPAQRGRNLAAQMSSYLGGCQLPFLGNAAGFAMGSQDIPANKGECSTIQVALHNP